MGLTAFWHCAVGVLAYGQNICTLPVVQMYSPVRLRAFWITQQKELDVSFFQALVLLLFNDGDTLSLAEIAKGTKIGMPRKAGHSDLLR